MASKNNGTITIRDGLWALMLGYASARADAIQARTKVPDRGAWMSKWLSSNLSKLAPDFTVHANKIIARHNEKITMELGGKKFKVNAAEFIVDSLFALDVGVESLPEFAVKVPQSWVDEVKGRSQKILLSA